MVSLRDENYLKQLTEEAENLKRQNCDYNTQLNSISLQNDFLEKTVQWFTIFQGLAKENDTKRLCSENLLFADLVCNIFEKGAISSNSRNSIRNDQTMGMEKLIKTMDDIINDTESVYEFYNDIPIVKTYKAQLSEFKEKSAILKSLEEQNPILKKDIEHFSLIFEEQNQLIVKMVTNSGQIKYTENEIQRISRDFNEYLSNKNEIIKDLNKKIEELKNKKQENEKNNKVTSKFTLSHIDIFKVPAVFPQKILKNPIISSKLKDNEHRNKTTINLKKQPKSVPTFPILPLHRQRNNVIIPAKLQESTKNIQIIENIQIKSGAESKSGNRQESASNATTSKYNLLKLNVIHDSKITNKETIKVNANDVSLATIPDNTENKNATLNTNIIEHNIIQQKPKKFDNFELNAKKNKPVIRQQTTKNDNISITSFIDEERINKTVLPTKITLDKYKFVDKSEISIQNNMDLNKTKLSNINMKYYTDSKKQIVCSPKKRLLSDDILNNNKNKLVKANNYTTSEKNEIIEISEDSNKMEIQSIKDDICKIDFAYEISSNESVKSTDVCDFNFDGPGNMNFDDIVGNDNNFFGSAGGDLEFSSDNQFGGANCDSFKF